MHNNNAPVRNAPMANDQQLGTEASLPAMNDPQGRMADIRLRPNPKAGSHKRLTVLAMCIGGVALVGDSGSVLPCMRGRQAHDVVAMTTSSTLAAAGEKDSAPSRVTIAAPHVQTVARTARALAVEWVERRRPQASRAAPSPRPAMQPQAPAHEAAHGVLSCERSAAAVMPSGSRAVR